MNINNSINGKEIELELKQVIQ